jgi:hypothetical protein
VQPHAGKRWRLHSFVHSGSSGKQEKHEKQQHKQKKSTKNLLLFPKSRNFAAAFGVTAGSGRVIGHVAPGNQQLTI